MRIELPRDETRVAQLREKLAEYKKRRELYEAHGNQMAVVNVRMKIAILELLLEYGWVETDTIREQFQGELGADFDPRHFANASETIQDYCRTGGANVFGGTGLPPICTQPQREKPEVV